MHNKKLLIILLVLVLFFSGSCVDIITDEDIADFNTACQYIDIYPDAVSKTNWFYSKGARTSISSGFGFYLYCGLREGSSVPWIRFKAGFQKSSWVFFEQIYINYDGKIAIFFFDYFDVEREVISGSVIKEYVDILPTPMRLKTLEDIANSSEVTIRFSGESKNHDRTLSQEQKNGIKYMLSFYHFYYALEDTVSWEDDFTDNADGTITDGRTGLVWLKNADCYSYQNWDNAISATDKLNSGECGLSDGSVEGDWRLPTKDELQGIGTDPPTTWYDEYPSVTWEKPSTPFVNVQSDKYWSSTTYTSNTEGAWGIYMYFGDTTAYYKTSTFYVWPVRSDSNEAEGIYTISGNISGDTKLEVTISLYGDRSYTTTTASDGSYSFTDLKNGNYIVEPSKNGYTFSPTSESVTVSDSDETEIDFFTTMANCDDVYRFLDNADGTVTDCRTELIWLKNANCYGEQVWDSAFSFAAGLNNGECGLSSFANLKLTHLQHKC